MNLKNVQTYVNVLNSKEEWKYFSIHCYWISEVRKLCSFVLAVTEEWRWRWTWSTGEMPWLK